MPSVVRPPSRAGRAIVVASILASFGSKRHARANGRPRTKQSESDRGSRPTADGHSACRRSTVTFKLPSQRREMSPRFRQHRCLMRPLWRRRKRRLGHRMTFLRVPHGNTRSKNERAAPIGSYLSGTNQDVVPSPSQMIAIPPPPSEMFERPPLHSSSIFRGGRPQPWCSAIISGIRRYEALGRFGIRTFREWRKEPSF